LNGPGAACHPPRMGFRNIARQGVHPNQTVRYEVDELATVGGRRPAFYVEHYSITNPTVMASFILGAGGTDSEVTPPAPTSEPEVIAQWEKGWADKRGVLAKHCIRGVENFFHDGDDGEPDLGHAATLEDVPAILEAIPFAALARLFSFVVTVENFAEVAKAKVEDVAKK
jgi:hypothetical protein